MNRNFASFHRAVLGCLTAAGLIGCGASESTGTLSSTDSPLAAVEATQAGIGEMKAQAEACLDTFALCVADGGETCRDDLRACTPKPPKMDKLDGAMAECKAGNPPPPLTDDELSGTDTDTDGTTDIAAGDVPPGEAANKPGPGNHPKCPPPPDGAEADGEGPGAAAADGSGPPPCPPPPGGGTDTAATDDQGPPEGAPEGGPMGGKMGGPKGDHKGECGKIEKAAKKAGAKCDHHHEVVKVCIDDLELCVTDGGAPAECAAAAKECLTAAAEARFGEMCANKLAECNADATSTEQCAAIATKCAEGPVPPPPAADATSDETASAVP